MKKIILMAVLSVMMTTQAAAQQTDKVWTLNSRAWSTNYFTTALYCLANALVTDVACKGNTKDSLMLERILPDALHAVAYRHARKPAAAVERPIPDARHAVRYHHVR